MHDAAGALILVSILVVIFSLLKNGFIFAANFMLAPIRAFLVRDIRNDIGLLCGEDQLHRSELGGISAPLGRLGLPPQAMRGQIGKGIEYLPSVASGHYHSAFAQQAEMKRGAGLRKLEFLVEGHHVHLAFCEQCHNAEPRLVAKRVEYSGHFCKLVYS